MVKKSGFYFMASGTENTASFSQLGATSSMCSQCGIPHGGALPKNPTTNPMTRPIRFKKTKKTETEKNMHI